MKRRIVEHTVHIDVQDVCYLKEAEYSIGTYDFMEIIKQRELLQIGRQFIQLTATKVGYGMRYWFECPTCSGRTKKLYKTAPSYMWQCRTCHNLTYVKSNLSGNEFNYVGHRILALQKELQVTKENSYPLLGIPHIMIEWMPRFKPHYMRWEKFEKKRAELKRLIYRYVDLWMASIRY